MNINILDINDNAPIIQPVGILEIFENVDSAVLTTLQVTDRDQDSQLEISISNNPEGVYSINNQGRAILNVLNHLCYFMYFGNCSK